MNKLSPITLVHDVFCRHNDSPGGAWDCWGYTTTLVLENRTDFSGAREQAKQTGWLDTGEGDWLCPACWNKYDQELQKLDREGVLDE